MWCKTADVTNEYSYTLYFKCGCKTADVTNGYSYTLCFECGDRQLVLGMNIYVHLMSLSMASDSCHMCYLLIIVTVCVCTGGVRQLVLVTITYSYTLCLRMWCQTAGITYECSYTLCF